MKGHHSIIFNPTGDMVFFGGVGWGAALLWMLFFLCKRICEDLCGSGPLGTQLSHTAAANRLPALPSRRWREAFRAAGFSLQTPRTF